MATEYTSFGESPLTALLRIEPARKPNCIVASEGADADSVSQQVKSGEDGDGECHTEVVREREDGTESSYLVGPVTRDCVCPVFESHDCIPEIESVEGGEILVSVTARDGSEVREVIEEIKKTGASVKLERLINNGETSGSVSLKIRDVTEKQRDALEAAVEMGYYEKPREASLEDLALEIGVSKSAVSQRLNCVEAKLVGSLAEGT